MSDSNRLLAVLNIAMADTAFTTWSGKRFYGAVPNEVTWRPVTSIPLADTDGNPDTAADPDWLPLVNTPCAPGIPCRASQPQRRGGDRSAQLLRDQQTFTLTTAGQPNRTYTSIAQARSDGNNARVWGGMHYPSTVEISDAMGEAIADYVNRHSMQRRPRGFTAASSSERIVIGDGGFADLVDQESLAVCCGFVRLRLPVQRKHYIRFPGSRLGAVGPPRPRS